MNPTDKKKSKAVAVGYDPRDQAPKVLAAGQGGLAEKIKTLGLENHIPVLQDQDLVDQLIDLEVSQEIPESLYEAVAKILAFVYSLDRSPSRHITLDDTAKR